MPVERLHAAEELLVVAAVDQDLSVALHRVGQNPGTEQDGDELTRGKILLHVGHELRDRH